MLSIPLNALYLSPSPSITLSLNQKGPLFFTLELPPHLEKEWKAFQAHLRDPSHEDFAQKSSWISAKTNPQWLYLNTRLLNTLKTQPPLRSYDDLQGQRRISIKRLDLGSVFLSNIEGHLTKEIKADGRIRLETLIAWVGGDQAQGRFNFRSGRLEIHAFSSPKNSKPESNFGLQIRIRDYAHLTRFHSLWSVGKAFPNISALEEKFKKDHPKSSFSPQIGQIGLKSSPMLKEVQKELGLKTLKPSLASLKSSIQPQKDFLLVWRFPQEELPQNLWLLVQVGGKTEEKESQPLYLRVYLNSKFRQDHLKSKTFTSQWKTATPLSLPPSTPLYLLDIQRGPWTCLHPVCIEEVK